MTKRKWPYWRKPFKILMALLVLLWTSYVIFKYAGELADFVWSVQPTFRQGEYITHSSIPTDKKSWTIDTSRQMAKQPVVTNSLIPPDDKSWMTDANRYTAKHQVKTNSLVPTDKKSWMINASRQVAKHPILTKSLILTDNKSWTIDESRLVAKQPIIPKILIPTDKKSWMTSASRHYMEAKQPIIMNNLTPTDKKSWMTDTNRHVAKQPVITNSLIPTDKKSRTIDASGLVAKQSIITNSLIPTNKKSSMTDAERQVVKQPIRIPKWFGFLIDMPTVCSLQKWNSSVEALVFITSSYEHEAKRQSLRKSWLLYSRNNTANVRYIFILGISNNRTLSQSIVQENIDYKDVVVANFLDAYRNLTMKTIAGFHWATKRCAHARFVMKTDDDVYVNIPGLLNQLQTEDEQFSFGKVWRNVTPRRNSSHKWFVPVDQYPNTTYPDYFDGLGYILSMKHVHELLNIYPTVNFLPLEDIFVGLCLKRLGFRFEDKDFYVFTRENLLFPPCFYKHSNVIAAHGVPGTLMETVFKKPCRERDDLSKSQWYEIKANVTRYRHIFTTND